MTIHLTYQCTLDDYQQAWAAAAKAQHSSQGSNLLFQIVIGIVVGIAGGIFLVATNQFKSVLYLLVFLVLWALASATLRKRQIVKVWRMNTFLALPVQQVATPEGVAFHTSIMKSEVTWRAYTHFAETPNLFVLFLSPHTFQMVPKRAFADEQQLGQYRALLGAIGQQPIDKPPIPQP